MQSCITHVIKNEPGNISFMMATFALAWNLDFVLTFGSYSHKLFRLHKTFWVVEKTEECSPVMVWLTNDIICAIKQILCNNEIVLRRRLNSPQSICTGTVSWIFIAWKFCPFTSAQAGNPVNIKHNIYRSTQNQVPPDLVCKNSRSCHLPAALQRPQGTVTWICEMVDLTGCPRWNSTCLVQQKWIMWNLIFHGMFRCSFN